MKAMLLSMPGSTRVVNLREPGMVRDPGAKQLGSESPNYRSEKNNDPRAKTPNAFVFKEVLLGTGKSNGIDPKPGESRTRSPLVSRGSAQKDEEDALNGNSHKLAVFRNSPNGAGQQCQDQFRRRSSSVSNPKSRSPSPSFGRAQPLAKPAPAKPEAQPLAIESKVLSGLTDSHLSYIQNSGPADPNLLFSITQSEYAELKVEEETDGGERNTVFDFKKRKSESYANSKGLAFMRQEEVVVHSSPLQWSQVVEMSTAKVGKAGPRESKKLQSILQVPLKSPKLQKDEILRQKYLAAIKQRQEHEELGNISRRVEAGGDGGNSDLPTEGPNTLLSRSGQLSALAEAEKGRVQLRSPNKEPPRSSSPLRLEKSGSQPGKPTNPIVVRALSVHEEDLEADIKLRLRQKTPVKRDFYKQNNRKLLLQEPLTRKAFGAEDLPSLLQKSDEFDVDLFAKKNFKKSSSAVDNNLTESQRIGLSAFSLPIDAKTESDPVILYLNARDNSPNGQRAVTPSSLRQTSNGQIDISSGVRDVGGSFASNYHVIITSNKVVGPSRGRSARSRRHPARSPPT